MKTSASHASWPHFKYVSHMWLMATMLDRADDLNIASLAACCTEQLYSRTHRRMTGPFHTVSVLTSLPVIQL